jgi:hypothetical protein
MRRGQQTSLGGRAAVLPQVEDRTRNPLRLWFPFIRLKDLNTGVRAGGTGLRRSMIFSGKGL